MLPSALGTGLSCGCPGTGSEHTPRVPRLPWPTCCLIGVWDVALRCCSLHLYLFTTKPSSLSCKPLSVSSTGRRHQHTPEHPGWQPEQGRTGPPGSAWLTVQPAGLLWVLFNSIKASETPYGSQGSSPAGFGLQHRSYAWQRQQSSFPHPVPEWPGVTNGSDGSRVSPAQPTALPKAWKMHSCSWLCCPRDCCVPVGRGRGSSAWVFGEPWCGLEAQVGWQWEPGCFSWYLLRRDQPGAA